MSLPLLLRYRDDVSIVSRACVSLVVTPSSGYLSARRRSQASHGSMLRLRIYNKFSYSLCCITVFRYASPLYLLRYLVRCFVGENFMGSLSVSMDFLFARARTHTYSEEARKIILTYVYRVNEKKKKKKRKKTIPIWSSRLQNKQEHEKNTRIREKNHFLRNVRP